MADSFVLYTASGSTDTFNITFGYLDQDHVSVSVDNVDVAFTFPSSSQVQITSGNPTAGAIVKVYRETPRDAQQVVWVNAANLTSSDLNTADLQTLYIVQEAFDAVADSLSKDNSGIWDADSIRIQNVATPTASTDAVNKAYVDALIVAGIIADADYGDITVSGDATVWTIDANAVDATKLDETDDYVMNSLEVANTGLRAKDTDASHYLAFKPGTNLTDNRTLTITTGDSDRTLDISAADVTITAAGSSVLDDATVEDMRTTLEVHPRLQGTLTISSGSIAVDSSAPVLHYRIATEGAASSDDLDTITGGTTGQVIIFRASATGQDVVIKDNATNFIGGEMTLSNSQQTITLLCVNGVANQWLEVSRSHNDTDGEVYEIGTWTPEFDDDASASTVVHDIQDGTYVRKGDIAVVSGYVSTSSFTAAATEKIRIRNIPFTCNTTATAVGSLGLVQGFSTTTCPKAVLLLANNVVLELLISASSDARNEIDVTLREDDMSATNNTIRFSITYQIKPD